MEHRSFPFSERAARSDQNRAEAAHFLYYPGLFFVEGVLWDSIGAIIYKKIHIYDNDDKKLLEIGIDFQFELS